MKEISCNKASSLSCWHKNQFFPFYHCYCCFQVKSLQLQPQVVPSLLSIAKHSISILKAKRPLKKGRLSVVGIGVRSKRETQFSNDELQINIVLQVACKTNQPNHDSCVFPMFLWTMCTMGCSVKYSFYHGLPSLKHKASIFDYFEDHLLVLEV